MNTIQAITVILAHKTSNLSQTKWNKLLFFIDGAVAALEDAEKGATAVGYVKLPYGPVPNGYRDLIANMQFEGLVQLQNPRSSFDAAVYVRPGNTTEQTARDFLKSQGGELPAIVDKVLSVFGSWTAGRLSNFSHELDAWKNAQMYEVISLLSLRKDSYLRMKYREENYGKLLMKA